MICMRKILWPVLLVVFASCVAAVPVAHAETSYPAVFTAGVKAEVEAQIDGAQVPEAPILYVIGTNAPWTCATVKWDGDFVTNGPESEEIYVDPVYSECHTLILGITKPVEVTVNGCEYRFTATTTEKSKEKAFTEHMDIVCPEGKKIQIHVYNDAKKTQTLCTYEMGPQSNETEIKLTNEEKEGLDDIRAKVDLTSIELTRVAGSEALCGAENPTGTYQGEATFRATNELDEFVDLTISG